METAPETPVRPDDRPVQRPRVAVGIADTDESDRTVRWGAEHARRTGGALHLVHAFVWPLMHVDVDPVPGITGSGLRAGAEALVRHAEEIAREVAPGIDISSEIVEGRTVDVMLAASREADVLAVGSRGLGRMLAMVMGSTSLTLVRRADCPVVVVRGDEATDGPIGVAYESTDLGEQALVRAGALAGVYDTSVHLVIGVATPAEDHERILEHARRVIGETTPGAQVELSPVASARDARRLVEASEGTRALVVPARTEGPASASSQTAAVVQLAHTPIWVERWQGRS